MKTKQFNKLLATVQQIEDLQSKIGHLCHFVKNEEDSTPELMQSIAENLKKDAEKTRKRILEMI